MEKLITIDDMTQQVKAALDGLVEDFDIEAIVEEIHRAHGLIDIDGLDGPEFWAIVERHDLVNVPPSRSRPCGEAWVAEIQLCPTCGLDASAHVDANARRTDVDA